MLACARRTTSPKDARSLTYAEWNATRGSVIMGHNNSAAAQATVADTAAITVGANPLLLASNTATGGFFGTSVCGLMIFNVDHTTDANAADHALVQSLVKSA
jgi:hypothetical protein